MNHDTDPHPEGSSWRQVFLHFPDYAGAEHTAAAHLGPQMTHAETTGVITSWFFIRKNPCWRLRFLPAHDSHDHDAATLIHRRLDTLHDAGHLAHWVETVYEPETHAFGGTAGMRLAHRLFHADSRHILTHLAGAPGNRGPRREVSILLCSTLMRAAGQDWAEQGDIWARVADTRPHPTPTPPDRLATLHAGLQRLMTVDPNPTSPLLHENRSPAIFSEWAAAFTAAGRTLGELAHNGTLRRGVRAVLAHHILFHWNRLGLPYTTQSLLAHTATTIVLGCDGT